MTDKNGQFYFNKPNNYFSISVDLESLPLGYGVDKHNQFFSYKDNSIKFLLNRILNTEINEEAYENINPVFKSSNNIRLFSNSNIDNQVVRDTYPQVILQSTSSNYVELTINQNVGFRVYYETGMNRADAEIVADHYALIYDYFCVNNFFLTPKSSQNSIYYNVYLTNDLPEDILGRCRRTSSIYSYIQLSYDALRPDNWLNGIGTLAHEYFHAIMNTYNIYSSNGPNEKWMHEAFSTFSSIDYISNNYSTLGIDWEDNLYKRHYEAWVSIFLKDMGRQSLTSQDNNRHYGAFLYPLYISERLGGLNTIRKILESYNSSGKSVLTAIDNGLQLVNSNYSFEKSFIEFSSRLSLPHVYYKQIGYDASGWENTYALWNGGTVFTNQHINQTFEMVNLSSYYYEYTISDPTQDLSFTIDCSDPNFRFYTVKTYENGDILMDNWNMSTGRITIKFHLKNYKESVMLIPINISKTDNLTFSFTLDVSDHNCSHNYHQHNSNQHIKICYDCDFTALENHSFTVGPDGAIYCRHCYYYTGDYINSADD